MLNSLPTRNRRWGYGRRMKGEFLPTSRSAALIAVIMAVVAAGVLLRA